MGTGCVGEGAVGLHVGVGVEDAFVELGLEVGVPGIPDLQLSMSFIHSQRIGAYRCSSSCQTKGRYSPCLQQDSISKIQLE